MIQRLHVYCDTEMRVRVLLFWGKMRQLMLCMLFVRELPEKFKMFNWLVKLGSQLETCCVLGMMLA